MFSKDSLFCGCVSLTFSDCDKPPTWDLEGENFCVDDTKVFLILGDSIGCLHVINMLTTFPTKLQCFKLKMINCSIDGEHEVEVESNLVGCIIAE